MVKLDSTIDACFEVILQFILLSSFLVKTLHRNLIFEFKWNRTKFQPKGFYIQRGMRLLPKCLLQLSSFQNLGRESFTRRVSSVNLLTLLLDVFSAFFFGLNFWLQAWRVIGVIIGDFLGFQAWRLLFPFLIIFAYFHSFLNKTQLN